MYPVDEQIFCPAIYFILLCTPAVSIKFILSISPHLSLSHSAFDYLYFFVRLVSKLTLKYPGVIDNTLKAFSLKEKKKDWQMVSAKEHWL